MGNDLYNLLPAVVTPGILTPEFDVTFYRRVQDDLAGLDDDSLVHHYEECGRSEGRIATPAAHRCGFLAQIPTDAAMLEIGPAVRPSLYGDHVRYFDITDRDGLIARAVADGYPTGNAPPAVHYISPVGDLSVVDAVFDGVFSSHCIEHQPDLVAHLQGVARILKPNGRYFLIVPDKRYCFDALLRASTLDEVREAHAERRRVHTTKSVFEHAVLTTHNDPEAHWAGNSGDPHPDKRQERAASAAHCLYEAKGGYIDVHAWQFTPESFRAVMTDLREDGSEFEVERVYATVRGRNEFCAVLRKAEPPRA